MRRQIVRSILWLAGSCIILFGILVLILTFSEYQPRSQENIEIEKALSARKTVYEGDCIEILTWNISYGGMDESMDSLLMGGEGAKKVSAEQVTANLEAIIEQIKQQNYDVLFLQQVDRGSARSVGINEEKLIHEELSGASMFAQDYRCLFVPYPMENMIGAVNGGLQTLSRLSVGSAQRIAIDNEHEWPARTWERKPCLLVTRIPVQQSGREVVLINLQMKEHEQEEARQRQMRVLTDLMEAEYAQGNYVIAGGDFHQVFPNDMFKTYPIRRQERLAPHRMPSQFVDWRWQFVTDDSAPTRRLADEPYSRKNWWTQFYVTDGFILSPNITLLEVETIQDYFRYSDHNPVRLRIELQSFQRAAEETQPDAEDAAEQLGETKE